MSSGSLLVFQSTLLQEERPFLGIFAPDCCQFQSTLLQEERRVKCKNTEAPTMISIHAPTRGATFCGIIKRQNQIISIHAPTRGATGCYFFVLKFPKISIHAPTRGATLPIIRDILFSAYFNPRSYKRSDIVFFASVLESSVFQSTLLQEERPGLLCTDHRSLEFQSTLLQEERHRIHWIL